jgi:hypothetical protein
MTDQAQECSISSPFPFTRQNVRSYPLCNCGNRWLCDGCRNAWIRRRERTSRRWLQEAISPKTRVWFVLLSIPSSGSWFTEMEELWKRWRKLGRTRTLHRQRKDKGELAHVLRGVASLHLVNKERYWGPHLHAVLVASDSTEKSSINRTWQSMGEGFAEAEEARSLGAVIRYSIAGELPDSQEDRMALARVLHGKRLVRRIGS